MAAADSFDDYKTLKSFFFDNLTRVCPDNLRFNALRTAAFVFIPGFSQRQHRLLKQTLPGLGITSWEEASAAADRFGRWPVFVALQLSLRHSVLSRVMSERFNEIFSLLNWNCVFSNWLVHCHAVLFGASVRVLVCGYSLGAVTLFRLSAVHGLSSKKPLILTLFA